MSFLNQAGKTEKWEFGGGSWVVGSFSQVGAEKLTELEKLLCYFSYFQTNIPLIEINTETKKITSKTGTYFITEFSNPSVSINVKIDEDKESDFMLNPTQTFSLYEIWLLLWDISEGKAKLVNFNAYEKSDNYYLLGFGTLQDGGSFFKINGSIQLDGNIIDLNSSKRLSNLENNFLDLKIDKLKYTTDESANNRIKELYVNKDFVDELGYEKINVYGLFYNTSIKKYVIGIRGIKREENDQIVLYTYESLYKDIIHALKYQNRIIALVRASITEDNTDNVGNGTAFATEYSFNNYSLKQEFLNSNYIFQGLNVSLVTDSISTFEGYLADDEYETWYPKEDVTNPEQMWWSILFKETGMKLLKLAGWSGSLVTGDATSEITAKAGCSTKRINDLKNENIYPNIIINYIGYNDIKSGKILGDYKANSPFPSETSDMQIFSEAYATMIKKELRTYTKAKIFCCTLIPNTYQSANGTSFPYISQGEDSATMQDYNNRIREIAINMGCEVIDFAGAGITLQNYLLFTQTIFHVHPNLDGQKLLGAKAITEITKKLNNLSTF